MRWENLYVAGLGAYLPEQVYTAEQAVADGRYGAGECEANGYRAVRVASAEETGPVMAAAAGRTAVGRSGIASEEFRLVVHASVGHQGQDVWTPAHYVQNETVGGHGAAFEVRQGSNSGLAAAEVAASWITARPEGGAALVTTGDSFKLPYWDRWKADEQVVYGDGAGALVLSTRGGFAKVRSSVSRADASLEPLYRGDDAWTEAPFYDGKPADLAGRKRHWLSRNEDAYDQTIAKINENFGAVLKQALAEADTDLAGTQWFIHANMCKTIIEWGFHGALGLDPDTTVYDWGLDYAHMGGGDQIIGLNRLFETGRPKPGDLVVTAGAGIGFMWTVAVLEVLETPAW
ncbi:ketoacyl-ACP synthase III family protein [Kitasatospora sp. GAS204B]|uniref:ketoacyl-ACP synthase III family protein n=1 Tax=unclassified Kitasatospora TaxID=2633591 RepID=UPI0024744BD7|nr:ketoacyl-ACP synthase III family protein [Kitasatospora sp. GAS204B]MDH6121614.1 3-oxoacyl-[acyl-carrier-protein] synthase-3 [Kitasatospora sp. GAS204B]